MAGKTSSTHEWINTAISFIAFAAAGASAFFAWQANNFKNERLNITGEPLDTCPTVYKSTPNGGEVGLCWVVTIASDSEDTLSLVDFQIGVVPPSDITLDSNESKDKLTNRNGEPVYLPINLEAKKAQALIVRASLNVPPAVAQLIEKLPSYNAQAPKLLTFTGIEQELANSGIDILGSKLPNRCIGIGLQDDTCTDELITDELAIFTSGSGKTFTGNLVYSLNVAVTEPHVGWVRSPEPNVRPNPMR
jgi:hypothetical protein